MLFTFSEEFDAAFDAEIKRIENETRAYYVESPEFYEQLDKAVQLQLDSIHPSFSEDRPSGQRLRLRLSPPESDVIRHVDIEKALENDISYALDNENVDHLKYVLARLELMTEKVRGALSHNVEVSITNSGHNMTNKTTTLSPLLVVGLDRKVMRPGTGWKRLSGAVYEKNEVRVHMVGTCRLKSGVFVSGNEWPRSQWFDFFVKINGGNRKRGLMAFGNWLMKKYQDA